MIKQTIAAAAFLTCCLGNPANADTYCSGRNCNATTDHRVTVADDQINHSGHTYNQQNNSGNNRGNTTTTTTTNNTTNNAYDISNDQRQDQAQRQAQSQSNTQRQDSFNYQALTINEADEAIQHAPIPQPVGPAAPDSVAVLSIYYQIDQAGPVGGASISIPLN